MRWSKFNYLFESKKHGFFIYNSRSNAFLKISNDLYESLSNYKSKNIFNTDNGLIGVIENLKEAKIFVEDGEDENYMLQLKTLKYSNSFSRSNLALVIAPTTACNFSCPYCYEHNIPQLSMNKKVENDIMMFIRSFNIPNIELTWYGGEPLLNFNSIKRILRTIKDNNTLNLAGHSLVTNGYLLGKEKCEYFRDTNLDSVQITIDGPRHAHDKLRRHKAGLPTFDRIISNIDRFVEILPECPVILRVNISKANAIDFPDIYKMFTQRWQDKKVFVQPSYVTDHGNCNVSCFSNPDKIDFFLNLYQTHKIKNIDFFPKFQLGGCTADNLNNYVIGPEGAIYKCWVDIGKEDRVLGNVNDLNSFNNALLAEYLLSTNKYSDPKCLDCFLFPVCDGGCGAFRLEHKLSGVNYNECPIDKMDLKSFLEVHYEQQLENNEI